MWRAICTKSSSYFAMWTCRSSTQSTILPQPKCGKTLRVSSMWKALEGLGRPKEFSGLQLAVRHGVDRVAVCSAEEGPRSRGGAVPRSPNAVPGWRRSCCILLAKRLIFASSSAASYTASLPLSTARLPTRRMTLARECRCGTAGAWLCPSRFLFPLQVCITLTPCGSPSRALGFFFWFVLPPKGLAAPQFWRSGRGTRTPRWSSPPLVHQAVWYTPLVSFGFRRVSWASLTTPICFSVSLGFVVLFTGTRAGSAPRLAKRQQVKEEPPLLQGVPGCAASLDREWVCTLACVVLNLGQDSGPRKPQRQRAQFGPGGVARRGSRRSSGAGGGAGSADEPVHAGMG